MTGYFDDFADELGPPTIERADGSRTWSGNPYAEDAPLDLPPEVQEAEDAAELKAEFAMDWVAGGGRPADINAAYNAHTYRKGNR